MPPGFRLICRFLDLAGAYFGKCHHVAPRLGTNVGKSRDLIALFSLRAVLMKKWRGAITVKSRGDTASAMEAIFVDYYLVNYRWRRAFACLIINDADSEKPTLSSF